MIIRRLLSEEGAFLASGIGAQVLLNESQIPSVVGNADLDLFREPFLSVHAWGDTPIGCCDGVILEELFGCYVRLGGAQRRLQPYRKHTVQNTERCLGTKQDLVHAPNDGIKLRV